MDEDTFIRKDTNIGNVSKIGDIIGSNIKTGDINIKVIYKNIRNFGLNLLPPTYFKDNQITADQPKSDIT